MENIRQIDYATLEKFLLSIKEPKFRAKQVYEWIWQKHAFSFDEMTNISKELRQTLASHFTFPRLSVHAQQESKDGTIKFSFLTPDQLSIEGVLIPTEKRLTACISSQVGCSLSCKFCATGRMGRKRNVMFYEMYDQVILIEKEALRIFGKKLTNIVFMGMGEPLLNYPQLMKAIHWITDPKGLGIGARRITVSTAGIAKMIRELGEDGARFNLALSLHAANDKKRNEIMAINESNNIKKLIESLNYFYSKTKGQITLEYILLKGFNDTLTDAKELVQVYRSAPVHLINIIEYNPIYKGLFQASDTKTTEEFTTYLANNRVNTRIRYSRGKDIDAACGQLSTKAKTTINAPL